MAGLLDFLGGAASGLKQHVDADLQAKREEEAWKKKLELAQAIKLKELQEFPAGMKYDSTNNTMVTVNALGQPIGQPRPASPREVDDYMKAEEARGVDLAHKRAQTSASITNAAANTLNAQSQARSVEQQGRYQGGLLGQRATELERTDPMNPMNLTTIIGEAQGLLQAATNGQVTLNPLDAQKLATELKNLQDNQASPDEKRQAAAEINRIRSMAKQLAPSPNSRAQGSNIFGPLGPPGWTPPGG